MFSATLTTPTAFANTFRRAVLAVLPMDGDSDGLRATDVNRALGMDPNARTAIVQTLKQLAKDELIARHETVLPGQSRPLVTYTRLLPLRKRERIARWIMA